MPYIVARKDGGESPDGDARYPTSKGAAERIIQLIEEDSRWLDKLEVRCSDSE